MTKGNEPAFSKAAFYHPDGGIYSPQEGLTKREYFAATALQGAISAQAGTREMVEMQLEYYLKEYPNLTVRESLAKESVKMADELIKALNEKPCNE